MNMKTKVKFMVNENGNPDINDIFAFFPDEYDLFDLDMRSSYSHIGQHSACHVEYAKESRLATKDEYTPLREELKSIGYDLVILNPFTFT